MKKILKVVLIIMALLCLLTGCAPKAKTIWVENNEVKFSIEYKVFDVAYDGFRRVFSVKDNNEFETMLSGLDSYISEIKFIESDKIAKLFKIDCELFYIYNSKNKSYVMSPATMKITKDDGTEKTIIAPPTENVYYSESTDIVTNRDWQYFVDFYSLINAKINNDENKITLSDYSLVIADGKLTVLI